MLQNIVFYVLFCLTPGLATMFFAKKLTALNAMGGGYRSGNLAFSQPIQAGAFCHYCFPR